jgi:ankyrin repeat protein
LLKLYLAAGADPSIGDYDLVGHGRERERRLEWGERLDPPPPSLLSQRTALHVAAADGATQSVVALLAAGADKDAKDRWGGTPLDEARREKRAAVVAALTAA